MMRKLDYQIVLPGLFIVATCYGLARYAYGLFLPIFREAFDLSDSALAYIAAISYASYFCITIAGIYLSTKLAPRVSVLLGGLAAAIGMAIIAAAQTPLMLAVGVAVAGVSPGLAYTPFSEIVATLVSEHRQRRIYSIINSGTSLGVVLSGPAAILMGEQWRLAWVGFAIFGLVSTIWCVSVLPKLPSRAEPLSFAGLNFATLTHGARGRLFVTAFLIGIATSIYWAFSFDLVTAGKTSGFVIFGFDLPAMEFGRVFWTMVGIAGFMGVVTGAIVDRFGVIASMRLFLAGIATAAAIVALNRDPFAVLVSGLMFGGFFVLMAGTLGIWSMDIFPDLPAVGFGTAFLLLSAGQFVGPVLVGVFIPYVGLSTMFVISAVFCALLAVSMTRRSARTAAV